MLVQAAITRILEGCAPNWSCLQQLVAGNGAVGSAMQRVHFSKELSLGKCSVSDRNLSTSSHVLESIYLVSLFHKGSRS